MISSVELQLPEFTLAINVVVDNGLTSMKELVWPLSQSKSPETVSSPSITDSPWHINISSPRSKSIEFPTLIVISSSDWQLSCVIVTL